MEPHTSRRWPHIILIIFILAAAVGVAIGWHEARDHNDKSQPASQQTESSDKISASRRACGIFTLAEAKQVLGESAKGGGNQLESGSGDIDTSTCNYSQDLSSTNAPVSGARTASLTVRIPKTADGTKSNQSQFGVDKPVTAQDVAGYGDSAYWDTESGQLNILKHDIWYSLRIGSSDPVSHDLQSARQLADTLINKM
jgi:hypothetical protein